MTNRTCTEPDCGKPHRARGLCASHWNAKYRKDQHREVPCAACGTHTVKNAPGIKRRPVCSDRCRYRITYDRWPEDGKTLVGPVERRRVQPATLTAMRVRRFVSVICRNCDDVFIDVIQLRSGRLSAYCSKRCQRRHHEWRISDVRRRAIYDRDGWACQLCMEPVDPTLDPSDMMSASLDHIECRSWVLIPDHTDRNLRLAHRLCNSIRSDSRTA